MKKILFFLTCIIMSLVTANAQKVSSDTMDEDGYRVTATKQGRFYMKATAAASIKLIQMKKNDDVIYHIVIGFNEGRISISKGETMVLKFGNEETAEISAVANSEFSHMSGLSNTDPIYAVEYDVPVDIMNKIIKDKLVKIRIQTNDGYIDRDINKATKYLTEALANIEKATQKPLKSKYGDF